MEINPYSAQNNSELDFGGLQRSDSSTSYGQQTQRNIRQDDQFHCELKHKETQQEVTKILIQNTPTNNFTEVSECGK